MRAPEAAREALREQLALNQPLIAIRQFLAWACSGGDLRASPPSDAVAEVIAEPRPAGTGGLCCAGGGFTGHGVGLQRIARRRESWIWPAAL